MKKMSLLLLLFAGVAFGQQTSDQFTITKFDSPDLALAASLNEPGAVGYFPVRMEQFWYQGTIKTTTYAMLWQPNYGDAYSCSWQSSGQAEQPMFPYCHWLTRVFESKALAVAFIQNLATLQRSNAVWFRAAGVTFSTERYVVVYEDTVCVPIP